MEFEWDKGNRDKNWLAHGVTVEEIEEGFFNWSLQFDDMVTGSEPRHALLGITNQGRQLTIVYTVRDGKTRVVSARPMSRKERKLYDEKQKKENPSL